MRGVWVQDWGLWGYSAIGDFNGVRGSAARGGQIHDSKAEPSLILET